MSSEHLLIQEELNSRINRETTFVSRDIFRTDSPVNIDLESAEFHDHYNTFASHSSKRRFLLFSIGSETELAPDQMFNTFVLN